MHCPTKRPEMTSSLSCKFDASKLLRLVRLLLLFVISAGAVTSPETKMTCTGLCTREESVMYGEGEEGGGRGEGGGEIGVGRSGKESLVKATVTIASAMDSNSFFLTRLSSPSGDIFAGYLGDLVHEISQTSSFRFRWSIVETEVAGGNRKHLEKWAELTERLKSEEANVSVLALTSLDHNDSLGLTFTRPFLTTTPSLLLKATPSTTPDPPLLPLQLEKLLDSRKNSTHLRFAVLDETTALKLNLSNSTLYRQLWGGKTPSEVVLTQEEGLRRVREEKEEGLDLILIMESTDAAYLSTTEPCDLTSFALSNAETRYVFAGLANSSLVLELDRILADLDRNPDFFERLYRKWWARDDCSTGGGREGDRDGDPDMERIFFTSPVKIFKSTFKPISSSRDWLRAADTSTRPAESKQVVVQPTEISSASSRTSSKAGRALSRKRRRTTSAPPTERPPVAPTVPPDDLDDIADDQSSWSGMQFRLTSNSNRREGEIYTINPVLKARTTAIRHDLGQSSRQAATGGPRGRDIQNDDLNMPRDKADDSEPSTTSKFKQGRNQGQFINNIDWFFVTHQPRYPQELDYDETDYNDDDDDNDDQKAAYEALDGVADDETATILVVMETRNSSANRNELVYELILLNVLSHSLIKLLGAVR